MYPGGRARLAGVSHRWNPQVQRLPDAPGHASRGVHHRPVCDGGGVHAQDRADVGGRDMSRAATPPPPPPPAGYIRARPANGADQPVAVSEPGVGGADGVCAERGAVSWHVLHRKGECGASQRTGGRGPGRGGAQDRRAACGQESCVRGRHRVAQAARRLEAAPGPVHCCHHCQLLGHPHCPRHAPGGDDDPQVRAHGLHLRQARRQVLDGGDHGGVVLSRPVWRLVRHAVDLWQVGGGGGGQGGDGGRGGRGAAPPRGRGERRQQ
mmetsp:Transcript_7505/g.18616  ORF Transcript_7505/g.18616 Transcript_7505/m.18616 type:complete len:266 (+) Transcript_7505:1789-2586(+)